MQRDNYVITTDNTTDLPADFFAQHGLSVLHIDYTLDDVCYDGETTPDLPADHFYERIRAGALPITQQANPDKSSRFFERYLAAGSDVLHIAFSSGLSGTYQSNCLAAEELRERYPDRKLVIIDSLCASMGEGLLVSEALRRQNAGSSLEEVAAWVEQNKLRLRHDVVADDLFHLQRGGRVSKTAAIFGSALGIKPRIHVNDEGKLIAYAKVRGKKAALADMADQLARTIDVSISPLVFISHSDTRQDAEDLAQLIRKHKAGVETFLISDIGPTIGAHTGTGTVALFYFGADRRPN